MIRILIVEDNPYKSNIAFSIGLENGLDKNNIIIKDNVLDAKKELESNVFTLLILDLNLPIRKKGRTKKDAGVQLLKMLVSGELNAPRSVVGVTSHAELNSKYSSFFKSLDFNLFDSDSSDDWQTAIENKIKWFKNGLASKEKEPPTKLVITVHGIRTAGLWQRKLEDKINEGCKGVVSEHFEFKNISSFKLLNPLSRLKISSNFTGQLRELLNKHPNSEIYFFSHSFGTYLLAKALENLTPENTPQIKSVVLAGSVLKRTYQWHKVKSKLSITTLVNDCGVDDKILLLSELFAVGLGMAGRVGFDSFKSVGTINRQHFGGHSFFEKNEDFYDRYWLPLISYDSVPNAIIVDRNSTIESLLDSLKYIFWGGFLIILFVCALLYLMS